MMYRWVMVCILTIGMVMPLQAQVRGERYLLLNEINTEDTQTLETVTTFLDKSAIPYAVNLSQDLYSFEEDLEIINVQMSMEGDYQSFIHASENIAISVEVGKDDIETILKLFIANEVPFSKLPDRSEAIDQLQLTQTTKVSDVPVIDITSTNKIIKLLMFSTGIIFLIFIGEGRKREKKKFFDKE